MYSYLESHPRVARVMELIGAVVLVNLVALLVSFTIVGIAPGIGAAFAYFCRQARDGRADIIDHFARQLLPLFWRSWATLLLIALPVGFAVANLQLAVGEQVPLGGAVAALGVVVGLVTLVGGLYLWPLIALVDRPIPELVRLALQLGFGHLVWSAATLAIAAFVVALSVAAPAFGGLCGLGFTVMIVSFSSWRVIGRYAKALPGAGA